MKRFLALLLTACLLLSLAPVVTAAGDGEGWSYRYRGDYADTSLTVSIYDAKTGDFTLRGFEEDYDPNTYEPIYPYTVPVEKTGEYWVHTSLLSAGEIFPQGGEFYALLWRQDYLGSQIVIHPLTAEEIANGLTVTETMFSALAELTFLVAEQSYDGSSNAAPNYTLVWQSSQLSKSFVDVSELLQLWGNTTVYCTPGYLTAARVCSYMDFDLQNMTIVYTAPSIVDIIQGSVSSSRTYDFSALTSEGKRLFTPVPEGEGTISALSVSTAGGFDLNVEGESFYIAPGVYDVSVECSSGSIFSGEAVDSWTFFSPGVDLSLADQSRTYAGLSGFASFSRTVKVCQDESLSVLRGSYPSVGETVYVDYDIRDPYGNRLVLLLSTSGMDYGYGEGSVRFASPAVRAGESALTLSFPGGLPSLTGFSFAATAPSAEHTVSIDASTAGFGTIRASDSFHLNNAGAAELLPPNAPSGLSVSADRRNNTAVFTFTSATHPVPDSEITEYRLYACDAGGSVRGAPLAVSAGVQISVADLAAIAPEDQTSFFTVRAFDGALESVSSNVVSVAAAADGTLSFEVTGGASLRDDGLFLNEENAGAIRLSLDVAVDVSTPTAILSYRDVGGEVKTVSAPMSKTGEVYEALLSIPADAASVTELRTEYATLSGTEKTISLPAGFQIFSGALYVTLEGLGGDGAYLRSAHLVSSAGSLSFDGPAWETSGDDLILKLPGVPRRLYGGARLEADFPATVGRGTVELPTVNSDRVTVGIGAVRNSFALPYHIALEIDDSQLRSGWRLNVILDLYAGGEFVDSHVFYGIAGSTELKFRAAGDVDGYTLDYSSGDSILVEDVSGTSGVLPLGTASARKLKLSPYVPENGSVIPITLDGEPLAADTAVRLGSYHRLWYAHSGMADLSNVPDGTYTLSLSSAGTLLEEPVTVEVSGGRIAGECPELKLWSQSYFAFDVSNRVEGNPGQEYRTYYDAEYQLRGSEEWLPVRSVCGYGWEEYSGSLFIGPLRSLDVCDENGNLAITRLRITPSSDFTLLDWNNQNNENLSALQVQVPAQEITLSSGAYTFTETKGHANLLNGYRYAYTGSPLTFTGQAFSRLRFRVWSQGPTSGATQLNFFFYKVDNLGKATGETYSTAILLDKYNEAAVQEAEDSSGSYAPGVYRGLYYTGPHDGAREDSFFFSDGQVAGPGGERTDIGLNGTETATLVFTLPAEKAQSGTFTATLKADALSVTANDLACFTYAFTADASVSGKELSFTPLGAWAKAADVSDLRASLTVDGVPAEASVRLTEAGDLALTLPVLTEGQLLRGSIRVGYGIRVVPEDGVLLLRAKVGENECTAACSCISFQHNIPAESGETVLPLKGRAGYPGEKAFVALYADGALSGWYQVSKYGFWGGGYGEYKDLTLPVTDGESRTFAIEAYLLTGEAAAIPASADGLAAPLAEKALFFNAQTTDIVPVSYIFRYYDTVADSVSTYACADAAAFSSLYLAFPQTYDQDFQELTLRFEGDVSEEITIPTLTIEMYDCRVIYNMSLDYAGPSGTSYTLRWPAVYHGSMRLSYGQRPLLSDTERPEEREGFRFASLTENELARLRAGWKGLEAAPDKTLSVTGSENYNQAEGDVTMNVSSSVTTKILEGEAIEACIASLLEQSEDALVLDRFEEGSDLLFVYHLPTETFDETNAERDIGRVGYRTVLVYRADRIVSDGDLMADDLPPSKGELALAMSNEFFSDINAKKGYFDLAKEAMEFTGAKESLSQQVAFQSKQIQVGDKLMEYKSPATKGMAVLGYFGTGLGVVTKFATESEITTEQRKTLEKRIADVNGMYSFALAKCKCKGNDTQAKMLAQTRDYYIGELQAMISAAEAEELNCDILSSGKDVALAVAGEEVNPIIAFAIDKGVDAGIDDYRYNQNIERYDQGDDLLVKCGDEMDRIAASCSKEGCKEETPEIKRKTPGLVEADLGDDSRWGVLRPREIDLSPEIAIDPSGIVYEGYLANPLEGVECVIYESDDGTESGAFREWLDAPGFDNQQSRQITGESGYYEWYVPAGYWKVTYAKEGYLPAESQVMKVAPQWLDVHQNLLALDNKSEASLSSAEGSVILSFSKPVIFDDILAGGVTLAIGGAEAKGEWSILRGGEGEIFADGVEKAATGTGMLVSELRFTPEELPLTGDEIRAVFSENGVRSYGGTPVDAKTLLGRIAGGEEPYYDDEEEASGSGAQSADSGSETGTLTPSGGVLSAFSGSLLLRAEEGIVSTDTKVTFERKEAQEAEAMSPVYGIRFAVQPSDTAEAVFRLDEKAKEVENPLFLGMWVLLEGSEEWQFAGGAYDEKNNTLTLLTRVNGSYMALYRPVSFKDLPENHWGKEYIDILAARRIMMGYDGKVDPDNNITRAELVALAVRVLRSNSLLGRTPEVYDNFPDVKPENWFWYEVNLAAKRGLVSGYEDGTMRPNDPITRQELAAVVARMAADAMELAQQREPGAKDAETIAGWAKTYVAILEEMGFVEGDENGNFRPDDPAKRCECAKLMVKLMELYGMLNYDPDAKDPPCLTCPYSR